MRTLSGIFLLMMVATESQPQSMAQDLTTLAIDPIPEEALKAAPGFGGSRPADSPQVLHADEKSTAPSENATAEWKPRLLVKLRIQLPDSRNEKSPKTPEASLSPFQPASIPNADDKNYAILKCDDVQVDVKTDDKGNPTYFFNCKGKAVISVSGNTMTADSMTTVDNKLSASNVVIEMPNRTIVRSDKLTLELTILEIEVKSAVEKNTELETPTYKVDDVPVFLRGA